MVRVVIILLFLNSIFCFSNIEGIYFRKVHKLDKGTIYIYLKNENQIPLKIEEIYLNDIKLEPKPTDISLWYQQTPPEIEKEGYGEVKIKMRWNTKKMMKITMRDNQNNTYTRYLLPEPETIIFTGIYFNDDRIYIYLTNLSEEGDKIEKIYINGKDITDKAYIPEKEIIKDNKTLIIIEEEAEPGKYLYIKITTEKGKEIHALQRAYSHFVIEGYTGDTRQEINFNPDRFDFHYDEKKLDTFKSLPEYKACHILDDPACLDGMKMEILGSQSEEIIKRIEKFYKYDRIHPTFIYGCEHKKPENYFIYSELVDIFVIDPYEIIYYHNQPEKNAYYVSLGKLACQPKILLTIPEAFTYKGTRYPAPEEERIIVWSEIGEGSKGIWYYVNNKKIGYPANKELEEEIKKINWELQKLKEYIKISEPVNLAKVYQEKITPYTLLCGDKGIILIVVNNDHKSYFEQDKEPFEYSPKQDIKAEIKIPKYLKIKRIKEIAYPGEKEIDETEYEIRKGRLILEIPELKITKQYLIETDRK